jgi:hypothetical protein
MKAASSRRAAALALFLLLAGACIAGFRAASWHGSLDYPDGLQVLAVPDVAVPVGLLDRLETRLAAEPFDIAALNLLYASEVRDGADAERRADLAAVLGDFGWRNSAAQQNLMLEAAQRGDVEAALMRADALLRRDRLPEVLLPAMRRMEVDDRAAAALTQRLSAKPAWRTAYFGDASHLSDEAARAARQRLLERMIARGDCPSSIELRPSLDAFLRAGEPQRAAALDACGRRSDDAIS